METSFNYCIITPAFNEADLIENTINSVLSQTNLPQRWVIVDDGSTDDTATIIKKYAKKTGFIQYHYRKKPEGQAYFASNVYAIMEGYQLLKELSYEFLAILDADITLPGNYYEKIIKKFLNDDDLGVISGVYENLINGKLHEVLSDRRSTPKAIQVFRREVFDKIGGFLPLKYGGEDTISCVMTRMEGWKAWSFPEIKVIHHRPTGAGSAGSSLSALFNNGVRDYNMAFHPLFFFIKVIRRAILEKPYIISGLLRLSGYIWAFLRRDNINLPSSVVKFIRDEQVARVINFNKLS